MAEDNDNLTSKIFVYLRSDGSHVSTLDIGASTLSPSTNDGTINNNDQRGMWSNGTTLFVVDQEDSQVYGYQLSDRTRDDDKNLILDAANTDPEGLWFDGRVLWVVDSADDKLYVYDLPGAQPDNTRATGRPAVRTPTSEDVLTATVTAGTSALGIGYVTSSASLAAGSLSTATFTVDGITYTVVDLYDNDSVANAGSLYLHLDKTPPREVTLSIAGESFSSASARKNYRPPYVTFIWRDANLSWTASDTISVSISVDSPPRDGDELRAEVSGITDDTDGLENVSYHYQWIRVDGADETELDGETASTYTTTADDVDKDIQVRVIFDDDAGNKEYPRSSREVPVLGTPPEVTAVALTSDPNDDGRQGNDDTYAIGDSVTATVTFDKAVDITGSPQLTLLFGTAEKAADCAAATNTTAMECSYDVVANDTAPSGVGTKANSLVLNSGTIYATGSTTNAATLTHSALALQSGHLVDGVRPTLVTTGNDAPITNADGAQIILLFSEDVSGADRNDFTVESNSVAQTIDSTGGTGRLILLVLATALTASDTNLTVALAVGAVTDIVGNSILAQSAVTILNQVSAAPTAPTGLTADPAPDETPQLAVDLSWTAPTSDGGSAITSHQYRYKVGSGSLGSWTTIDNSAANGANATSFTVTGLPTSAAPIAFTFEVRAINGNGNGAESDPATATIDVPDTINLFTATLGNEQAEVTWATPANNGSAILRYQYFVYNDATSAYVVANNILQSHIKSG